MLSPWTKSRIQQRMGIFTLLWGAMIATQIIFGVLLFLPGRERLNIPLGELIFDPTVKIFGGIAVLCFILSRLTDRFFFSGEALARLRREPWTAEHLRSLRSSDGRVPLYSETDITEMLTLPEPDRLIYRLLSVYFIARIVQWALLDACGVLGFVVGFTRQTPLAFLPFGALALFGLLSSRPKIQELIDFAKSP